MDWKGLFSNADPTDLPPEAAVEQDNAELVIPGQLDVRKGMREVWFENVTARGGGEVADITTLKDLLTIAAFNRPEGLLLLALDEDGNVTAGRCPV
ncbi:MAG TPA: hypothetical protein VM243_11895 [Phycisphaerae bacterium]|nr:hypothetical protein [Phycisphaerae bacterium]